MTADLGLDARLAVSRADGFVVDVRLEIPPDHTVALLGPNGAGKSTVVAALAGLLPIEEGRVTLRDRTLDDPAANLHLPAAERRVGVVFQDYVLFPHLSVLHNVAFGLRGRGCSRSEARRRALSWLEELGLDALADRRPGALSGGQAQRVALARALASEPELLLLDEPLAALDATTRVRLRRLLAGHLDRFRGPKLLITHDPTEAFLLADEIHVLEEGAITQIGTAEEIRLRPRTGYVADLVGSNLLTGTAHEGVVTVDGHPLQVADTTIDGSVLVTVHPRAISIYRQRRAGSPRNSWPTSVTLVEDLGERIRLNVGEPLPLTIEVTPEAVSDLRLATGEPVWVSIKATEIHVEAA